MRFLSIIFPPSKKTLHDFLTNMKPPWAVNSPGRLCDGGKDFQRKANERENSFHFSGLGDSPILTELQNWMAFSLAESN